MVALLWLGGRRQIPFCSREGERQFDEHEEDSGFDPPGSDLEPRDANVKRSAQVTTRTPSESLNLDRTWNGCLMFSRLVNVGHVPYVNAYEELPDEMKLEGKDVLLFRVEVSSWS